MYKQSPYRSTAIRASGGEIMDDKALFPDSLRQLGADRLAKLLSKVCLASPAAAEVVRTSLKGKRPAEANGRDE